MCTMKKKSMVIQLSYYLEMQTVQHTYTSLISEITERIESSIMKQINDNWQNER